ncbi:hypothetical protein MMC25_001085 [Agyrium rufum]|nr:hypothetical protein [Agyrium rufum]
MNGVLYKLRLAVRGGATRSRTASIGPATYLGFFHNQIAWKDQWHTHAPKARSIGIRLDHLQNDDQLQSQKDVFTKFSSNGPREVETEKDHSRILDPYLPLELRSQSWLENLAKFEGIGSVESLAGTLLAYLTNTSKVELLSLLGLQYGRWPAFLSLTKTLLDSERPTERLHVDAPWNGWAKDSHLSLRELLRTWEKESIVTKQLSHQQLSPSLDDMTKQPLRCLPGTGTISTSDRAGYVFLSLGCLLIEATNLSPERSREILSYVHQLLAMMHHYGLVPASIYDYTPEMEASGVHKPPSLHLLQSRILTILSDAAWSAMEKDITREGEPMEMKYARDEKELSKGEFRPRIRPLSPEIWLDFILWCCVETGRLSHAAWLITRLSEGPSTQSQWHTVGWPVVEEKLKLEETTRSPLKMETAWRRLLRVTGATENYSEGVVD